MGEETPTYMYYDDVHAAALDAGLDTHEGHLEPSPEILELLDRVQLPPGSRVLDVGCGAGRNAIYLAGRGFKVTAVDVSPNAIRLVKNNALKSSVEIEAMVADLARLDALPGRSFDAAIDARCSHLIVDERDRKIFFASIFALLAPGGWYLGMNAGSEKEFFPIQKSKKDRLKEEENLIEKDGALYYKVTLKGKNGEKEYLTRDTPGLFPLWPEKHRRELEEAGFTEIQIEYSRQEGRKPLPNELLAAARKA